MFESKRIIKWLKFKLIKYGGNERKNENTKERHKQSYIIFHKEKAYKINIEGFVKECM